MTDLAVDDSSVNRTSKVGTGGSMADAGDIAQRAKPPKRPNAFVSVRVGSPTIRSNLQMVQDAMVGKEREVKNVLTSLNKLHITLSVVHLEDEEVERYEKFLSCMHTYTHIHLIRSLHFTHTLTHSSQTHSLITHSLTLSLSLSLSLSHTHTHTQTHTHTHTHTHSHTQSKGGTVGSCSETKCRTKVSTHSQHNRT